MSKLPVDWYSTSIENAMEAIIDYRGKTPTKTSSGVPLITAKIIDNGRIANPTEFISEETYLEWMKRGFPKQGDVLITTEAPLGEVAQLHDERVALAQRVILLRGRTELIDNSYLKWVLQSPLVQEQLRARSTGSTVLGIKQSELRKVKFPYPPIAEQRRIADILDRADAVRRKRQAAIALTEELLRSAFLEKFGNPENSKHPVKPLSEICEQITDGSHVTPTYVSNGIPFLRVTDIQSEKIDWNRTKYIPIEEHRELIKRCQPRKGDVLYSKNGTIGIPKLIDWEEEFSIFVSLCLLRPKPGVILGGYLESFLKTPFALRQAMRHTKTGTVSNLHLVEIRQIRLPVPTLDLQEEWLSYRQDIEMHQKKVYQCVIEQDNLFNSLLQRAFSGEL